MDARGLPSVPRRAGRWPRVLLAYRRMALPGYALAAVLFAFIRDDFHAADSYVYWYHAGSVAPYAGAVIAGRNAYLYSPAFSQALTPVHTLPFDVFLIAWTLTLAAALWLVARELAPLALLFPPIAFDFQGGNIHLLLALAIVAGLRWPSAWVFVLLTKPSGGVGLLWFAARGEWRKLAVALATTAAIAGASYAIAPDLWWQWAGLLIGGIGTVPADTILPVSVPIRVAVAAGIVVIGARRDWPWIVPVAVCLAMPVIRPDSLAVLVAIVPLVLTRISARVAEDAHASRGWRRRWLRVRAA